MGSLIVYCALTVTFFTLRGNGQFTGVLVAPNADLAMHGGGNSDQDFCGSLMVNSVRLNGHFSFHWDEALGRMNSDNGARFIAKNWDEIPKRKSTRGGGMGTTLGWFPRYATGNVLVRAVPPGGWVSAVD